MITVKKNAIKYKSSDGTMKDSGVLCQVGILGVNPLKYVTTMRNLFRNSSFEDISELTIDCVNISGIKVDSFEGMFQTTTGLKRIKIKAYIDGVSMYSSFNKTDLETIDLSESPLLRPNDIRYIFYNSQKLREVIGEFDLSMLLGSGYTAYAFLIALALEEIRFKKNTISAVMNFSQSPLLSAESIQSIIDGLADLTGSTAQTITFHADVKAKLTEEQIATITSKNWTLA